MFNSLPVTHFSGINAASLLDTTKQGDESVGVRNKATSQYIEVKPQCFPRRRRDQIRLEDGIRAVELANAAEYRKGIASVSETRRTFQQSDGPRGIPEVTGGDEPRVDLEEVSNSIGLFYKFETPKKTQNGCDRSGCGELANRRSSCHSSPAWILRFESEVDSKIAINPRSYLCQDSERQSIAEARRRWGGERRRRIVQCQNLRRTL